MAITADERKQIIELTVLMFNAAPGAEYLSQIVALYEANPGTTEQKLQVLANQLATSAPYQSLHPNFETAEEFAAEFLTPLGLQNDDFARDFVISKFKALVPKGQIMYEGYVALNAVPDSANNQYSVANAILNNKTTVAEYYSINGGVATDLVTLQSVIATVTADPASVTAAQENISQGGSLGQTFALSTNQDVVTGTAGADSFVASVAVLQGGATTDTLQSFDQIDGGAGSDTLNVTLNATPSAAVTPSLTSVETVNMRATGAVTLNLGASTGVTAVNVENSTAVATLTSIGGAAVGVANQKGATGNVNINGSTATALALNLNTVGTSATDIFVDLGSATANAATSFAITANNAHVTFIETTLSAATTSATIAGTGSNEITFATADLASLTSVTTSGAGSVDLRGGALAVVKTLTGGDGGLKATVTNGTAGAVTATTGGGADTLSFVGAGVKSVSTGAGKDSVSVNTSALSATSTVDLGAGDDALTFMTAGFQFAAGATLSGGDGTDTIGMAKADYGTISTYTAANLAKVTGFEVLSITDALAGDNIDVSKITGIVSFTAANGLTAAATASNLGANSTVTLAGAAANSAVLTATLKADTSADAMTLVINKDFAGNNDTTATPYPATTAVTAADVESLTVNSTGNNTGLPFTPVDGYKADTATNTLNLTGSNKLTGVTVTGDQALVLASTLAMTKLATVDGSANTGGLSFDGSLADMTTATSSVAMTITGSATAANSLIGTGRADTIVGGAKADTLVGGAGADALTGGAGNDIFAYSVPNDSTLVNLDTIADFSANTFGNGTAGAAGTGAGVVASRTGDVIQLNVGALQLAVGVKVGVQANASDAQTFLQNVAADATIDEVGVALDSSSGRLYIDWDSTGTADSVIQLTGATTITAAAFVLV